jgi:hypothetical protein
MDYLIYLAFSYLVFSAALLIYIAFAGFAGIAYEWTAKLRGLGKVPAMLIVILLPTLSILHWSVWTASYVEFTMSRMQSNEEVSPWIWWILTFLMSHWAVFYAAAFSHENNPKCVNRHAWVYLLTNTMVFFLSIHFPAIIRWMAPTYHDGVTRYIESTIP